MRRRVMLGAIFALCSGSVCANVDGTKTVRVVDKSETKVEAEVFLNKNTRMGAATYAVLYKEDLYYFGLKKVTKSDSNGQIVLKISEGRKFKNHGKSVVSGNSNPSYSSSGYLYVNPSTGPLTVKDSKGDPVVGTVYLPVSKLLRPAQLGYFLYKDAIYSIKRIGNNKNFNVYMMREKGKFVPVKSTG